MCGRYVRRADKQRIAEAFETGEAEDFAFQLRSSYNIAPQTMQPVVRWSTDMHRRTFALMRWGLVPSWSRGSSRGSSPGSSRAASRGSRADASIINARAETLATNSSFRDAVKSRRCLVPADAFYEWQKTGSKSTQPFAIARKDGGLFAFAGIWEQWNDPVAGGPLETFAIITTGPNELMQNLHNRMPVILPQRDYDRWLAPSDPTRLPLELLRPCPAKEMVAWKVDQRVGNARNDDESLLQPVPEDLRLFPAE